MNIFLSLIIESFSEAHSTGIYYLYAILGLIAFILLCMLTLFFFKITIPLKTRDPASRLNNYFLYANTLQKCIISIIMIFTFWSENILKSTNIWTITILNFLFSFLASVILIRDSPFIEKGTYSVAIVLQSSILAASMSNIIQLIKSNYVMVSWPSYVVQTLVFMLFIFKIMNNWRQKCEDNFLGYRTSKFDSDEFFKLKLINFCSNPKYDTGSSFFERDLRQHFNKLKNKLNFNTREYLLNIAKNPGDNHTKLIAASILLEEFEDYTTVNAIAHKIITSPSSGISLKIGALYIQGKIEKKFNEINSIDQRRNNLDSYFFYDKSIGKLKAVIIAFLDNYANFFRTLNQETPCLKEISSISEQMQSNYRQIENEWRRVREKFDKIPSQLLKIYSIFLTGIKFRNEELAVITNQYQLSLLPHSNNEELHMENLINNQNVICLFSSVMPQSAGRIVSISNSVRSVLDYNPKDLIGKFSSLLHPKVISEILETLFKIVLDGEAEVTSVWETNSYLCHKKGDLISCKTWSMICFNAFQELCLGIVLIPNEFQEDVVLLDQNGKICDASKNFNSYSL